MQVPEFSLTRVCGMPALRPFLPALETLAAECGQPGTMHGVELLLRSQFARRKQPNLICFYQASSDSSQSKLAGAVLLLEYCLPGLGTGVFATGDSFGVRTVVGPPALRLVLCITACRFLLAQGARLVLTTWRVADNGITAPPAEDEQRPVLYALHSRTVQDTLPLGATADDTLQRLGKRTRVHLRADRRRFDRLYPDAELVDATAALAAATDDELAELNHDALDTIGQDEFNHQVRSLSRGCGGFVLGLRLQGQWISLLGLWRQGSASWVEWQCNRRGFEKLSLGGVLRTYLIEDEARRGGTHLSFHGGTSHSMQHSFQKTTIVDLLMRRAGLLTSLLVWAAPLVCRWRPSLLERGNFVLNALCASRLQWEQEMPRSQPTAISPRHSGRTA